MQKWEYKIANGAGDYVVLCDESAGDISPTRKDSFSEKLEISPGFGADSQGVTPNGNTLGSLEIPIGKSYASAAAAQDAILAMRALKGNRLNLKSTVIDNATSVIYYPSAVLNHMTANQSGRWVDYSLQFNTQDMTATAPA